MGMSMDKLGFSSSGRVDPEAGIMKRVSEATFDFFKRIAAGCMS